MSEKDDIRPPAFFLLKQNHLVEPPELRETLKNHFMVALCSMLDLHGNVGDEIDVDPDDDSDQERCEEKSPM